MNQREKNDQELISDIASENQKISQEVINEENLKSKPIEDKKDNSEIGTGFDEIHSSNSTNLLNFKVYVLAESFSPQKNLSLSMWIRTNYSQNNKTKLQESQNSKYSLFEGELSLDQITSEKHDLCFSFYHDGKNIVEKGPFTVHQGSRMLILGTNFQKDPFKLEQSTQKSVKTLLNILHFLLQKGLDQSISDFITNIPKENYKFEELDKESSSLIIEKLKKKPELCLALSGKVFRWMDIYKIKDIAKYSNLFSIFDIEKKKIFEIIDSTEISSELESYILDGIQNLITARIKISKDFFLWLSLLEVLEKGQRFHPKFFVKIFGVFEDQKKNKIKDEIVHFIIDNKISEEEKIYYLLRLHKYKLKEALHENILTVNADLKNSKVLETKGDLTLAINFINKRIPKKNLWNSPLEEKKEFYKFITSTNEINSILQSVIRQSAIKKALNEHIDELFGNRSEEAIEFLQVVFFEQYNHTFIQSDLNSYLERFLEPIGIFEIRPSIKQLKCFLNKILIPSICSIVTENTEKGLEWLGKFVSLANYPLGILFTEFDSSLLEHWQHFEELLCEKVFEKVIEKEPVESLVKDFFKEGLKWKSMLKDRMVEILLKKLEKLKIEGQTENGEKLCWDCLKLLEKDSINDKNWISGAKLRLLISIRNVSFLAIKSAVFGASNEAKHFCEILKSDKGNKENKENQTIKSLLDHIDKAVESLVNGEILFHNCQDLEKATNQDKLKSIVELLNFSNIERDFAKIYHEYFKKCSDFNVKISTISAFLNHYNSIEIIASRERELFLFIHEKGPTLNVSQLQLPQELEKFSELAVELQGIRISPFFKKFFCHPNQTGSEDELISACKKAHLEMQFMFQEILEGIKDDDLDMEIIQKYLSDVNMPTFIDDMHKIKTYTEIKTEDIKILDEVLKLYFEHEDLVSLSMNLKSFHSILKLEDSLLSKIEVYIETTENFYKECEQKEQKKVLAKDFVKVATNLKKELRDNGINDVKKAYIPNKIIQEFIDSVELFKFLEKMIYDNLMELKDFINDEEEIDINRKNVEDLEKVWKFKNQIFDGTQNLATFIQKLEKIIPQNPKGSEVSKGPKDIWWLDMEKTIKVSAKLKGKIERTLQQMNNKDTSFRVQAANIMKSSIIKIQETSSGKKVTFKTFESDLKPEKVFDFNEVVEFKEKAHLSIMNYQKIDETKGDIVVNLETLKRFISLVENLQEVLLRYKDLEIQGYYQAFIKTEDFEITFKVSEGNSNVERYKQEVGDYAKKWENSLNELYPTSYPLSHFYGIQLKLLHNAILRGKGQIEKIKNLLWWANIDFPEFQKKVSKFVEDGTIESIKNQDAFKQVSFLCDLLGRTRPEVQHDSAPEVKLVRRTSFWD